MKRNRKDHTAHKLNYIDRLVRTCVISTCISQLNRCGWQYKEESPEHKTFILYNLSEDWQHRMRYFINNTCEHLTPVQYHKRMLDIYQDIKYIISSYSKYLYGENGKMRQHLIHCLDVEIKKVKSYLRSETTKMDEMLNKC